jgi:hypothetical protein
MLARYIMRRKVMKIDIMHDYGIELIAETESDKDLLSLFHRKELDRLAIINRKKMEE